MRLTLRTLLAWLDDTLPPAEVREVGKHVSESPFAQELVDRINRVTRQRRLTIPGQSSTEATDPNIVASYLDNELPPDQVAEYEKRCLTSDVHLAEVASSHQILSLIGQKAKVPAEARARMYHLVRGRETMASDAPRAFTPPVAQAKEPTSAVIAPWTEPSLNERSFVERYGPYAGVAALLLLLAWSAWSLAPGPRRTADSNMVVLTPAGSNAAVAGPPAAVPGNLNGAPQDHAASPPQNHLPVDDVTPQGNNLAMAHNNAEKGAEPAVEPVEVVPIAPGALGVVGDAQSILLRWNASTRAWERLLPAVKLSKGDRLVNLEPFRSVLNFGSVVVELVGDTEIVLQVADRGDAVRFELRHGRVTALGSAPSTVGVGFGSKTVTLTLPLEKPVGMECLTHREPGEPEPATPSLRILATQGEVGVAVGGETETVSGPGSIEFRPPNHLVEKLSDPSPSWITEETLAPADAERGSLLANFFKPDVSPMRALVEALEADQEPVHRLAIEGLGGIGEIGMVVSAMNRLDAPATRRAAIAFLKTYADGGPTAMTTLREELKNVEGNERAGTVEKLLIGYSPKEAKEADTYTELVKLLNHGEVGVRELALLNLMSLTGRDSLQYDPDKPDGPGLEAWEQLLKSHELVPPT